MILPIYEAQDHILLEIQTASACANFDFERQPIPQLNIAVFHL